MTPLVFVHGFMGGSKQWNLQTPLAKDRELIAIDLPGFGKNAHKDALRSIPEFAEWVLAEVGTEQFELLGHSMGGMIAQEMIQLAPDRVRKLVLYATGAEGVIPERFEPIETSIQRAHADGAKSTARRISATWFLDSETAQEFPACAQIAEACSLQAIIAGLEAMQNWSGLTNLAKIALPTLVLWGDRDRTYSWSQTETLWRNIPDCRLAVLPACAHAVHLENPILFNQLVSDFLEAK
ncbi:alpha/beta hydrolase [uncultured Ruegeria sp.]|uniref:alpha/beta fold hydrolase n=1 Tax=uncultured Ruegeria sp. TaxID=259304 RepID=UPI0026064855|nr:alpha/beta hydrolase [uncultured Ruegeria sp.]